MNAHGISLDNLTLGYSRRVLLDSACVDFAAGELCALIGRNGTGKSTLLRAMCGLESAVSGSVRIAGLDVSDMTPRDLATRVAFVSTQRVRVANLRVRDVVALGRAPYTGWLGRLSTEDNRAVKEALAAVAMESFADKEMDTLSDGESQRVMIARALAQNTPVILLDEPTAFLDVPNRYEICMLLGELAHRDGKTVIFSSHDISIVTRLCDTAALLCHRHLYHGAIAGMLADGTMQKLFEGTPLSFNSQDGTVDFNR